MKKRPAEVQQVFNIYLCSLFCEITGEETIEYTAMTSFVFCHFMNGIMDSIIAELFSQRCDFFFASAGTLFSEGTHFEVFFCISCYNFAEEFSKFSSVFSFFKSDAFVSFGNFRITLAVSNTAHSEVHADFRTFTGEVEAETFYNFFIEAFGNAYLMFVSIGFRAFRNESEFFFRSTALRTFFRSIVTFKNITANANIQLSYSATKNK